MFTRHASSELKHLHSKSYSYLKKRLKGDALGLGVGRTLKECLRVATLALMLRDGGFRGLSVSLLTKVFRIIRRKISYR